MSNIYGRGSMVCTKHKLGLVEAACPYCEIDRLKAQNESLREMLQYKDVGGIAADYRHRAEQAETEVDKLNKTVSLQLQRHKEFQALYDELEAKLAHYEQIIEIGTRENSDFGDYSKAVENFMEAWAEARDENQRLREALEKIKDHGDRHGLTKSWSIAKEALEWQ